MTDIVEKLKRGGHDFKNAGKVYVGTCHTENDVNVTLEAFAHAVSAVENALG